MRNSDVELSQLGLPAQGQGPTNVPEVLIGRRPLLALS